MKPPATGSTLLGDVLSKIENSYYFYEPFRLIQQYLNASQISSSDELFKKITDDWTAKLFNCNLNQTIFNVTFTQNITTNFSRFLTKGMLSHSGISNPWIDQFNRNDTIVLNEEQKCKKSNILVLKTIRVSNLERTWKIIRNFKNMKIIHLLRDPRARQNSQKKLGFYQNSTKVCKNCANNLEIARKLTNEDNKFANNYFEFIYEKLAVDSISYMENMVSNFLKISISEELKNFIANITTASNNTQNEKLASFLTTSRNISTISSKWRVQLSAELRNETENNPLCQKIMDLVGYEY